MECPNCEKEMPLIDTTYSNIDTKRTYIGQHTGDIYVCEDCEAHFIDNFITGDFHPWSY